MDRYDPRGPFDDEADYNLATVDSRKVGYKFVISGEFMRYHLRLEDAQSFLDQQVNRYAYQLWTYVRAVNHPPSRVTQVGAIDITVPANWWQHLRQDILTRIWGLRWTIRRWPIRTTKQRHRLRVNVDLERFHLYPEAPDFGGRLGPIVVPHHSLNVTADWIGKNRRQGGPIHGERP